MPGSSITAQAELFERYYYNDNNNNNNKKNDFSDTLEMERNQALKRQLPTVSDIIKLNIENCLGDQFQLSWHIKLV